MTATLENATSSNYEVIDPLEIRVILRRLISARVLLTLHDSEGHILLLSSVLAINDAGMLVLDTSPDNAVNQRVMKQLFVHCHCHLDRIDVRFSLGRLAYAMHQHLPAFITPLPGHLLYLQRREFYRLPTPLADELCCKITLPERDYLPGVIVSAALIDISEGGIAVRLPAREGTRFSNGMLVDHATLNLPTGMIEGRLHIRHVGEFAGPRNTTRNHAGCEWVDLPPAMQSAVQRYMMRVERLRMARERGLI